METETRIMPIEAKKLAIAAGARDVPWVISFLLHCYDTADAMRSLDALRQNCAEKFQVRSRVNAVERSPAWRESGQRANLGRKYERAYE
jgi:hypothetical protein